MVWTMVLLEASCTMKPTPVTTRSTRDRTMVRESENAISPHPNTIEATGISRPRPRTLRREAR
jgi:hypothetical protein